MKYLVSIISLVLAISCNSTSNKNTTTYFGGQIVNPKSDFVLFLKDDKVIDTLQLDKNNRFINEYNGITEGLYTFKHGNEFQYIYLEPADSILIRLNTWDFDESLVYSGKGSSKNEFLINLFLQNEKEEMAMYDYFNLNEEGFQYKIDSLTSKRKEIFNEFTANELQISEGFKKLTNTAINFPLYRLKEVYPFYYKRAHKLDKFPEISDEFYKYRDNIRFDEKELVSFYPYQNYVVSYLYNLSYKLKEEDKTKDNLTINLLNNIAEKVPLEDFKNTLLKRIVVNDFLKSESSCSINDKTLNVFIKNCTNKEYIEHVNKLVNDSKLVQNNLPLQNFEIVNYNNEEAAINDVIKDKNSVIYFWSTEFMSSDYLVNRIKYLEKNHPNISFIGINIQATFEDLANEPNLKKLDSKNQFKLTNNSYAHTFLTSKYPRTIIVDNEGVVKNGFTYLDSKNFASELKKIEKN